MKAVSNILKRLEPAGVIVLALAGADLILPNGWLVKELSGNRLAQWTAGLCGIAAGIFLTLHSYLSMNAVEPLIWVGCALVLVRLIKTGDQR
jgi:hypothetical protein